MRCLHGIYLCDEMVRYWMQKLSNKWGMGNPATIAEVEGVHVVETDDWRCDWDARLFYCYGQWLMLVNARRPQRCKDFAISHELAHRQIQLYCDHPPKAGNPELERLCDIGAQELLFGIGGEDEKVLHYGRAS